MNAANVLVMKKGHFGFFSERKAAREEYKMSFTQAYIWSLTIIAFLWVYYVLQLNINATKGYSIRTLEIEQRKLTFEENLVDIKIAEAESLSSITTDQHIINMPNVANPTFLVVVDVPLTFNK